mgnify:CR=1 FL=1
MIHRLHFFLSSLFFLIKNYLKAKNNQSATLLSNSMVDDSNPCSELVWPFSVVLWCWLSLHSCALIIQSSRQSCTILIILYFHYYLIIYMLLTIHCNCLVTSPTNNYNSYLLLLVAHTISIVILCRKGKERKGKVKPQQKLT